MGTVPLQAGGKPEGPPGRERAGVRGEAGEPEGGGQGLQGEGPGAAGRPTAGGWEVPWRRLCCVQMTS